ncbi:type II secretion system GspH family protein [Pendulispora brunnea]|uniref:Type II secretion system GspH family protein n=1 Tax=Pendulispora brunnea TaxID=2905690 RepID=A0ABZ2KPD4_9BACT
MKRGFSLLEVMVAIAILGLALSVILSAQAGLTTSTRRAANMANAVEYGRCKMTEMEEKLLKMGYPELDDLQSLVPCCNDETDTMYTCDTRVEKVVLPNPPSNTLGGGDGGSGGGGDGGLGGLSNLASAAQGGSSSLPFVLNPAGGAGLNLNMDAGMQGLGSALNSVGGADGLISMAMGIVYPSIKPLMEASIRRLTVTVRWKEGSTDKEITMVQYVTNPQRGNLGGALGFDAGTGLVGDGGVPIQ